MKKDSTYWSTLDIKESFKKIEFENLFTKSAFIYFVWDKGNKEAKKFMTWSGKKIDEKLTERIKKQIRDIDLRKRWMLAKYDGTALPRVSPPVRRHFEKEFNTTYPQGVQQVDNKGVRDIKTLFFTYSNFNNLQSDFEQKTGGSVGKYS